MKAVTWVFFFRNPLGANSGGSCNRLLVQESVGEMAFPLTPVTDDPLVRGLGDGYIKKKPRASHEGRGFD